MRPISFPTRLAVVALLLTACSGASSPDGGATVSESAVGFPADAPQAADASTEEGQAAAPPSSAAQAAGSDTTAPAVPRMVIRTGQAQLEVKELEPAVQQVQQLAARLGGYISRSDASGGEQSVRQASLEVKVPAARFDEAVSGLRPIGTVERVGYAEEDVGEEFVDVTARLENARRLEARLLELLATRTGNLEQVMTVERELARIRGEIEQMQGRLRYLRTRVAVSTLTVSLHEAYPLVGDYPGSNPILNSFRKAWSNFIGFIAWFISSLGILIPAGIVLFALWMIVRALRRRFPRTPRPPRPPRSEPPMSEP